MDQKLLWSLFIIHAGIYLVVSLFLMIINLLGDFRYPWFLLVWIFWGSFLFLHYQLNRLILSGYFQRLQDKLIEKLEK